MLESSQIGNDGSEDEMEKSQPADKPNFQQFRYKC